MADRTQSTLWEVENLNPFGGSDEEATGHGTQKPVELMRRPILNNTVPGDIVYDPFLGSGTTLIAAQETERVCFGLDIDPRYVDVIVSTLAEGHRRRRRSCEQMAVRSTRSQLCGRPVGEVPTMPRPKFESNCPNNDDSSGQWLPMGIPQEDIAAKLGIRCPKTLRKHFGQN